MCEIVDFLHHKMMCMCVCYNVLHFSDMKRAPNSLCYFICFLSFIFNMIRFFHLLLILLFLSFFLSFRPFYYHPTTTAFRVLLVREQTQCKAKNPNLLGYRDRAIEIAQSVSQPCTPIPTHKHKNSCNSFLVRQHIFSFLSQFIFFSRAHSRVYLFCDFQVMLCQMNGPSSY